MVACIFFDFFLLIRLVILSIEFSEDVTLFLDEIGYMSLGLQINLLLVFQEKEITPIGGKTPWKVNIQVISATHQDLREKVRLKE